MKLQTYTSSFETFKSTLYKKIKSSTKYYKHTIQPTLFGNFLVLKEHGTTSSKKASSVEKNYFNYYEEAISFVKSSMYQERANGYK